MKIAKRNIGNDINFTILNRKRTSAGIRNRSNLAGINLTVLSTAPIIIINYCSKFTGRNIKIFILEIPGTDRLHKITIFVYRGRSDNRRNDIRKGFGNFSAGLCGVDLYCILINYIYTLYARSAGKTGVLFRRAIQTPLYRVCIHRRAVMISNSFAKLKLPRRITGSFPGFRQRG